MKRCAKLGLGTVQWGMPYGIANKTGQPTGSDVELLLSIAKQHHIDLLDTASTYGEAESRLGQHYASSQGFRIVTKTPPVKSDVVADEHIALVRTAFKESLRRLKCEHVYGLMVHHADNLFLPGAERLWDQLAMLKASGVVEKVGVSVYTAEQTERVLDRFDIDLVQLPFNIYDQRFAQTGVLRHLKKRGVEVHSRSAFLQGLLLMTVDLLPQRFEKISHVQKRLHDGIARAGISAREACLRFCLEHVDIDRVVVGCETPQQLLEIIDAAEDDGRRLPAMDSYAMTDDSVINPSTWPR